MLEILKYPDEKLREKSEVVSLPLSKENTDLLTEMYRYVKDPASNALGLSAIQVGVAKRMCAIRYNGVGYKLINPTIIAHNNTLISDTEGCLSVVPDRDCLVPRWGEVTVSAFDAIQNKWIRIKAVGLLARILQHEIDHMNGILYINYSKEEK